MADSFRVTVKIAELVIDIISSNPYTHIVCRNYITDEEPMLHVHVTEEEEEIEVKKWKALMGNCNISRIQVLDRYNGTLYINNQNTNAVRTTAAYKKIVEAAIPYGIFLMHGAAIALNDECFLFTARSGTGKTTHIKLWLKNKKESFVVNGDKPLIKVAGNDVLACGSPWCGKEWMNTNVQIPLKAIIIMERSEDNKIEEISFEQAYPFLLQQTYLPIEADLARKTLELLLKLFGKVKCYRFYFNNYKDDCFETSFSTLISSNA